MKKYIPLILLALLVFTHTVFAQDIYNVVFMIKPFVNKADGEQMPEYQYGKMVSGDQITLDLQVMDVTITAETWGQHVIFSFDRALELVFDGVKAEVRRIVLEEDKTAHLRTPTLDAGADLQITWNRYEISPIYQDFIGSITQILNGEPSGRYGPKEDYSVMFELQSAWQGEKTLGYTLLDVEGDETDELVFGEMKSDLTGTPLYDLYTIRNGEIVHVFDGWDRNRYYLAQGGVFVRQGSNGASNFFTAYYGYSNGELHFIYSVIYDANRNPSSPWFLSYTSELDSAAAMPISQADAQSIMGSYTGRHLNLTSFSK